MSKRVVIVIIIYLLFMVVSYIYCLPQSEKLLFTVIINSITASTFGFAIILAVKIPKFVGVSSIYNYFGVVYSPLPFIFSVPMTIVTLICIVKMYMVKDFEYSVIVLPTIVIIYSSYKVYSILKLEKANLK